MRRKQTGATFITWDLQVLETDSLVEVRGRRKGTEGNRKRRGKF